MPGADPEALALLEEADRLHLDGQLRPACERYLRVLAHDAGLARAWYGLGCALSVQGERGEAIGALRRAVALQPDEPDMRVHLAEALFALGHVSEAIREYERVGREGDPALRGLAARNIACLAPGDPAMDNAAILRARRRWVALEAEAAGVARPPPRRRPEGRIRIGYVGTFFGARNWMKMYMGVINAHDRDAFEVHLIADGDPPSAEAGYRDHADDRIWQVDGVPNDELAALLAEARLDVLVNLTGYSHQDRLPLFLHYPAPVQIAWNGMYATTGFAAVDCVIGDPSAVPPEEERFCVERVRRVPATYLAFDTFYPVPVLVPPPHGTAGHVTFGSLVSAYKITDEVVASWSRVLNGVPGARLLLRNRALDHASNRAHLTARFAVHGVPAGRLALEGGGEHAAFLETYDRIDIALDAFPYSGATTTAEALWQGVPVLTFNGDRWAARTSRSILVAAGLGEWVAEDQPGFEAMAIRMGRAPESLAELRRGLRDRVAASPACDTGGLCRALEAIYRGEVAAKL